MSRQLEAMEDELAELQRELRETEGEKERAFLKGVIRELKDDIRYFYFRDGECDCGEWRS